MSRQRQYRELAEGEAFGEHAILTGEQRNMTVTAVSDMLLSRIDADRFIKLIKEPALKYIDYSDLAQNPESLILDIRPAAKYNKNHLEGSRNIPFFSLRMFIKELIQEKNKIIIVCEDEKTSDAAAFELIKHRVNALVLTGGMQSIPKDNDEVIDEPEIELTEQIEEINAAEDTELSLQQENQILKADNERLVTELTLFKKQYKLLFRQTEKLKAVLDKLRAAK
ncbi:rhodanese-like domain-containing protein [Bathymodiolus platifrons methanotrophic gill symbiont]|uniref:rhodanese-like domain-containing protein n=1 Tax=Bathymodiolus platifrons methanotrophic gill symbiont TaxID=113268 RepID=UPI0027D7B02A|nr:rhodanese-like domain-containing protein [Bathymodiolus platifrons methanotrophic gill symbiont]